MSRKKLWKKSSGGGFALPLRRSFEREVLEQRGKYGDPREIRPRDRATEEEVRKMKLTRREQRLAEMDREIALNEIRNDEVRLSQAQSLNEKAARLMQERNIPYLEAVRLAAQEQEPDEPTIEEVEAYARENGIEDFGQAVRKVVADHGDERFGGFRPRTGGALAKQEEAEIKRIAKERGYGDI
jgi:hypothetical protein